MTTEEQENFYRHSTGIVDETKESFLHLLDFYLKKENITLHRFIEINEHVIYHMCYNRYPCCQCPSYIRSETRGSRVLHQQQLDILFDSGGKKLSVHNPQSKSAPHCCSPVNSHLQLDDLDFTLARLLLVTFTSIVPNGSVERIALNNLVKIRNESFAHAKEGRITNDEYKKSMSELEKSLLVLARVYGKERETKQKLSEIAKQPLNSTLCLQLQNTLLQQQNTLQLLQQQNTLQLLQQQNTLLQQCHIYETVQQLIAEKNLPDCLTKDLCNVTVTEGCDAHFEIRTKECGLCSLWLQDGVEIVESEKVIAGKSGKIHSLDIRNTSLSQKGLYTVKLKDIERHAHLDVKEYFTKNLHSMECIEGETAEFTCEVVEDSLPARWNKNGINLENDGKYEILKAGKGHRLSIKNCNLCDRGNYGVCVNNRVRKTFLNVIEYFKMNLQNVECIEGETAEFTCEVKEDSLPARWNKNGNDVESDGKYEILQAGTIHKLSIRNSNLHDTGSYGVSINNRVRTASLNVIEYFTKPLGTRTCTEGETVQFECEVLDDNQKAMWFKGGTEVSTSNKYKVEIHGKRHRFDVINTRLCDKGKYSVKIKQCVRHFQLNVLGIEDTRFKQPCHVCEQEPSVYWCHDCQRSRCQNCNNQHRKSSFTKHHIVHHVQDMYSHDYNMIKRNEDVRDIQLLNDELLVIACGGVVICHISGQLQQIIPLDTQFLPTSIAVIDKNTVAVKACDIYIVDISQRQVRKLAEVTENCRCIIYRDNKLFVGCFDSTIKVINMTGEVTRTIPVEKIPYYICGGEGGLIYYTDFVKLYCVDSVGNTLFTFTDPEMTEPCGITTDDEGHVLVICEKSNNVLRISPDGKQCEVIITQIPFGEGFNCRPCICYTSLSKSVVIGNCKNVFNYKNILTPGSDRVVYSTYL